MRKPITIRLEFEAVKELDARAQRQGITRSDYAREIIFEALNDQSELARLQMEVSILKDELSELRGDLAVAVQALLVAGTSGQKITSQDAKAWVQANMKGS